MLSVAIVSQKKGASRVSRDVATTPALGPLLPVCHTQKQWNKGQETRTRFMCGSDRCSSKTFRHRNHHMMTTFWLNKLILFSYYHHHGIGAKSSLSSTTREYEHYVQETPRYSANLRCLVIGGCMSRLGYCLAPIFVIDSASQYCASTMYHQTERRG